MFVGHNGHIGLRRDFHVISERLGFYEKGYQRQLLSSMIPTYWNDRGHYQPVPDGRSNFLRKTPIEGSPITASIYSTWPRKTAKWSTKWGVCGPGQ